MITTEQIKRIAESKLEEGNNFIVEIKVKPGNKITVLLDNDKGVSIADCVAMSRHIEANLDRGAEDFELNVMSPGLTEPFIILRQYYKNVGKEVDVLTNENTKITGKLLNVNDDGIEIETINKQKIANKKTTQLITNNINLNFKQIKQTKIVLSF